MEVDEFKEREERQWQGLKKFREQSTLDAAHAVMESRKEGCSSWDIFEAAENAEKEKRRLIKKVEKIKLDYSTLVEEREESREKRGQVEEENKRLQKEIQG